MLAQAEKVYANEAARQKRAPAWPHVHGRTQFSRSRVKRATVVGRVLRELDLTNKGEEWKEGNVTRMVLELKRASYEDGLLRKAVERIARSAWLSCSLVRKALLWEEKEIVSWCPWWDVAQKAAQVADRIRRCLEGSREE